MKSIVDHEKEQNEKHENVNEEMKKLIIDQEHQLLSKQKSLQDEQNKTQLLLGEDRQRLDNALKKGDIIDAQAGNEKVKLISEERIQVTDELLIIQSQRKKCLFSCTIIQKQKAKDDNSSK